MRAHEIRIGESELRHAEAVLAHIGNEARLPCSLRGVHCARNDSELPLLQDSHHLIRSLRTAAVLVVHLTIGELVLESKLLTNSHELWNPYRPESMIQIGCGRNYARKDLQCKPWALWSQVQWKRGWETGLSFGSTREFGLGCMVSHTEQDATTFPFFRKLRASKRPPDTIANLPANRSTDTWIELDAVLALLEDHIDIVCSLDCLRRSRERGVADQGTLNGIFTSHSHLARTSLSQVCMGHDLMCYDPMSCDW